MLWDVVYPDRAPDGALRHGDELTVAGRELRVLHTPGHSPGGVCLVLPDGHVFGGDTLFRGGPGATGRSYSDFPTIIESIRTRLLTLPPRRSCTPVTATPRRSATRPRTSTSGSPVVTDDPGSFPARTAVGHRRVGGYRAGDRRRARAARLARRRRRARRVEKLAETAEQIIAAGWHARSRARSTSPIPLAVDDFFAADRGRARTGRRAREQRGHRAARCAARYDDDDPPPDHRDEPARPDAS